MSKYTKGYCALQKKKYILMLLRVLSEKYMPVCLSEEGRYQFTTGVITASYPFITEKGMVFGCLKSSKYFRNFLIKIKKIIRENLKKVLKF